MKRRAAGLLGLALAFTAAPAAATTRTFGTARVDLTMPIDPSCPTDAEVLDGLAAALGPLAEAESSVTFRVLVEISPRGTVGTVEGRGETRRVAGATCREVAEAIALVLVLSIEAHANTSVDLPVVAPPPAPPKPRQERVMPPRPAERPRSPISFGASANASLVSGLLPSAAGLGTVAVVIRHTRIPLEARVGIGGFLPARLHVARGELDFQAFRAFATLCGESETRLSFGLCTGITLDTVFTTAKSFLQTPDTTAAIPSLTLGPTLRYTLGKRLAFGADAEAGVVLAPTRWHVVPAGEVHGTAAVEGRLGFFGEVRFW